MVGISVRISTWNRKCFRMGMAFCVVHLFVSFINFAQRPWPEVGRAGDVSG